MAAGTLARALHQRRVVRRRGGGGGRRPLRVPPRGRARLFAGLVELHPRPRRPPVGPALALLPCRLTRSTFAGMQQTTPSGVGWPDWLCNGAAALLSLRVAP